MASGTDSGDMTDKQDSQNMTARAGQAGTGKLGTIALGKDNQDRIARTRQLLRTSRNGQPWQEREDRMARTCQEKRTTGQDGLERTERQDDQNMTAAIGQLGQYSTTSP
jgi:hypothetical protein